MATRITENSTYEDLIENAREQSRSLGCYAAVVEIVTYMQSRSRVTVMVSTTPIKSFSRGGSFVGLMAQYRNGLPYGDGRPIKVVHVVETPAKGDDEELPF